MNADDKQKKREFIYDILTLCVLIGLFFTFMIGSRPLSVPDEGRYVEIAREMVTTGDYVTPRVNGVKYFEKPALFYWLESFAVKLFGLKEFALRLWPALFALFGCLAVYWAGRRLYDRRTGLISSVILATSLLYYALSRVVILDMPVSVLLTVALLSFLVGTHEPPGLKRRFFLWSFYVFAALAVLTKGLIGIVIPAMVIGAWIIVLGEWRLLKTIYLPSGLALFLLIAVPWHVLVGRANPEFFNFYFIHEHFLRYLTKIHGRYEPAWFFIPILLLGFLPWTPFLVQAIMFSAPRSWQERHEHRDAVFLLLWAGLIFLFFSASDSKLIPYILPVFPPLALIVGRFLASAWSTEHFPGIRTGYGVLFIMTFAIAVLFIALPYISHRPEVQKLGDARFLFAMILLAGAAGTWKAARSWGVPGALSSIMITAVLFLAATNASVARIDPRTIKPLAEKLKTRVKANEEVASYETYYQDLPVYLERRIMTVDWKGELEFGTTVENTSEWIIGSGAFWKRWNGPGTMYMLTKRKTYDSLLREGRKNLFLIAGTDENVLVVNSIEKPRSVKMTRSPLASPSQRNHSSSNQEAASLFKESIRR